jgi:SAM-dependent methyltransferase
MRVSDIARPPMSDLEHWESRFSDPEYIFGTAPNEFLRSQAHLLPAQGKALAVADGEGRNGVWLAERGLDVLSVDFSPKALAKARALADARGVSLQLQRVDLITWAWPTAGFDVVVGIFFQWATPEQRARIFAGIRQALKPGGLLLLQGYRPGQLAYKTGGPSEIENFYTRAVLTEAFAGFADLEIAEHDSVIEEGTRHSGMAALIDLVGRK